MFRIALEIRATVLSVNMAERRFSAFVTSRRMIRSTIDAPICEA